MSKEYKTAREVALMLRTSHVQIYEWARTGVFPPGCVIRLGRKVLFDAEALAAFAARGGTVESSQAAVSVGV